MAGGPFDYITPAAQQNPFGSAMQGFALGNQVQQQQQQQQLAQEQLRAQMQLQRQYQSDISTLLQNPNAGAKDFAGFQLKYPQFKDATKAPFEALSEDQRKNEVAFAGRAYSALNSGRKDLALSMLDDRLKAMENSGANPQQIAGLRGTRDLIDALPVEQARNAAGMYVATISDPKQASSIFGQLGQESRAQQLQPFKTEEARIGNVKTQAEIDNVRSQIGERADRLGLDRDKYNLDFDKALLEKQEKQLTNGVKLSAGMEKIQADAVGAASIAQQNSDDAANLAEQFKNANIGRGSFSTLGEYLAQVTGNQDAVTSLRKRYVQMKNQAGLSMLPAGPASDTDIKRIDAGFLPETADSKEIAEWAASFARVQKAVALKENAKADWISEVGNTGKTTRDIEVSGIKVPAGTSFNDFVRRGLKPQDITNPPQPAAGQPRYLDRTTWGRSTTVDGGGAVSPGVTQLPPA